MQMIPADSDELERLRPRLFGIAYRMLGQVQDAEDTVQEAMLRLQSTDRLSIASAEAWLVAVTTRLAIDRLRRAATERAAYAGPWLPEPLLTEAVPADREAELASDLSMAFLVLLERLAPEERAAFLLRDVFDVAYGEIGRTLGRSDVAVRQLVHRARERVRRDQSRFTAPADARERLLHRFIAALEADDQDALLAVFADEATFTSDGGGRAPAMRGTLVGADRVARALLGFQRMGRGLVAHRVAMLNGSPAIVSSVDDRIIFATFVEGDGERVAAVYRVLNPGKLGRLGGELFQWPEGGRAAPGSGA
ncbi:MAG: RNA polymerase sigma factor SigJ [Gemmatimonadaceae bacterium]